MKLSSVGFDTTKISMLINFTMDENFIDYAALACFISDNKMIDRTYSNIPEIAKVRVAWSLIKCGVKYEYGKFYHEIDNKLIYGDLTTMLNYILNPILEFGSK